MAVHAARRRAGRTRAACRRRRLTASQAPQQRRVVEEAAVRDRRVDAGQVLVHDAAGADVHVADFGIAHLAVRQADVCAVRLHQRVRTVGEQPAPVRQRRQRDRIVGRFRRDGPSHRGSAAGSVWVGPRGVHPGVWQGAMLAEPPAQHLLLRFFRCAAGASGFRSPYQASRIPRERRSRDKSPVPCGSDRACSVPGRGESAAAHPVGDRADMIATRFARKARARRACGNTPRWRPPAAAARSGSQPPDAAHRPNRG